MRDLYYAIKRWQDKTFGRRTKDELLIKLHEEVNELTMKVHEYASGEIPKAKMMEEVADVQMVLFAIAHRFTTCFDSYSDAVMTKHNVNRKRKWMRIGDGTWKHLPDDMTIIEK